MYTSRGSDVRVARRRLIAPLDKAQDPGGEECWPQHVQRLGSDREARQARRDAARNDDGHPRFIVQIKQPRMEPLPRDIADRDVVDLIEDSHDRIGVGAPPRLIVPSREINSMRLMPGSIRP